MLTNGNFKLVLVHTDSIDVTEEIQALHKDLPCDAVILSILNTTDNTADAFVTKDADLTYDESNEEIYWGTGRVCGHQLFPKDTTFYIGVNNANDIDVRCSTKKTGGSHRVFFSCFRYVPIKGVEKNV